MSTTPASHRVLLRTLATYAGMVLVAVLLFLLIRARGETLLAPDDPTTAHPAVSKGHILPRVLLALVVVIVTGQVLGKLLARLGQPPVIGEVLAGILLGPSFLGTDLSAHLLPPEVEPSLRMIAHLGVILYMFVVGLELDPGVLRGRAHATLAIAHAGIALPFVLGAALALPLYPRLSSSNVPFTSFALFLGVALSITAFPVLARILTDRQLSRTRLGLIALTCAAVGDATAWVMLALVVGVVGAEVDQAMYVALGTAGFIALMLLVVRPILARLLPRGDSPVGRATLGAVFAALLLSALATEAIGIHALFGAFLFGAIIPHDSAVARTLGRQLEDVVLLLLLPAFFALTGMRTRIDLVTGVEQWLMCGLIIVVATAGKFGGTLAAARLTGLGWHDAAALGVLMNTRGLMELIVLNVGLDLGVISPALFSMMVLMALVTTVATSPALQFLLARRPPHSDLTSSSP